MTPGLGRIRVAIEDDDMGLLRRIIAFAVSLLVLCALSSFISTQSVLHRLEALEATVPMGLSMQMIFKDILGTLPLFFPIFGTGLLLGLLGARLAERFFANPKGVIHAGAGFICVLTTLMVMEAAFGIVPIAGARTLAGVFWMSLAGALSGLIYRRLAR
ncbi:hypothetical protein [Thioalkalivibrio sp. HK1]|uniref:hypothetical protein n=1 Tax=Thioalkalivibrio sp. HK1 TaxID=1469245 RepID=UPI00047224AA|nr:hypothetical protein [Thioalkalivibrio sp. HK1]